MNLLNQFIIAAFIVSVFALAVSLYKGPLLKVDVGLSEEVEQTLTDSINRVSIEASDAIQGISNKVESTDLAAATEALNGLGELLTANIQAIKGNSESIKTLFWVVLGVAVFSVTLLVGTLIIIWKSQSFNRFIITNMARSIEGFKGIVEGHEEVQTRGVKEMFSSVMGWIRDHVRPQTHDPVSTAKPTMPKMRDANGRFTRRPGRKIERRRK